MDFQLSEKIAEYAAESGLYRIARSRAAGGGYDEMTKAMALMIVLRGEDLGLGPATSLEQVRIYKGKLTLPSGTIAGCIQRSQKYSYKVLKHDDYECTLEFTFPAGVDVSHFTIDDARKAGIWSEMWDKYPRNMLFARALTNGARWYCAEVFGGAVYTPDELQDADKAEKPTRTKISPKANVSVASQIDREIQQAQPQAEGENLPNPITDEEWAALEDKTGDEVKTWAKANQTRMTTEEVFRVKALLLDKKIVQKRQLEAIKQVGKEK